MKKIKGQTVLEYSLLVTIVLGAIVATTFYLKRGIQGKWKDVVDSVGEQYDPTVMISSTKYSIESNAETVIKTTVGNYMGNVTGIWTNRYDSANSIENRTGESTTGGY